LSIKSTIAIMTLSSFRAYWLRSIFMSIIAAHLKDIKPSPTLAATAKAAALKAQGMDVIGLSAGEPDFDTPDFIKTAAIEAINKGFTKYTAVEGIATLKEAICQKFARENNLQYKPKNVIVGVGAKQVIYNAMMASLDPGDEVIIPAPYWVSYVDIVALAKGKPVIVEGSPNTDFKILPDQLEKAITSKTKWLILNSPNNPAGALYDDHELRALADVLVKHPQVFVLSDDIYEHLTYDGRVFFTIAQVAPELFDRTLTVNGVSKSYSMTGWRIGYGAGPEELIKAIAIIQSQSTSNACSISQMAALAALTGPQDLLKEWRKVFTTRRNVVFNNINDIKGLKCSIPMGAFYMLVNCRRLVGKVTPANKILGSDVDVVEYLLEEGKVALVPGAAFGVNGYFRLSYATSENIIRTACERIGAACSLLK
jgi:aspartate aminotransferase